MTADLELFLRGQFRIPVCQHHGVSIVAHMDYVRCRWCGATFTLWGWLHRERVH